jgi:hypothetical protein
MMRTNERFGKMGAHRGESCTNPGQDERFTTPCCYADVTEDARECPHCGAPIVCEVEQQPVAVCRIADKDEEEER